MAENDDDFVGSLGEMICYYTSLHGMDEPDCIALSAAITEQIREQYQGERVTVKKINRSEIREKVRAEFNGQNMLEIMERYGISRATVYRYTSPE